MARYISLGHLPGRIMTDVQLLFALNVLTLVAFATDLIGQRKRVQVLQSRIQSVESIQLEHLGYYWDTAEGRLRHRNEEL